MTKKKSFLTIILAISFGLIAFGSTSYAYTISGTVYEDDGTVSAISGGDDSYRVGIVVIDASEEDADPVAFALTDNSDGTYTATGIPDGDYMLFTFNQQYYADEWYSATYDAYDEDEADIVTVSGGDLTGKDFYLGQTDNSTISGTIYESNGTTEITPGGGSYVIVVDLYNVGEEGMYEEDATIANPYTGEYMFTNEEAGTYWVRTNNFGMSDWTNDFYRSTGSDPFPDITGGTSDVTVGEAADVTGINFQLDQGQQISGTVYEGNGTTPVYDLIVISYGEATPGTPQPCLEDYFYNEACTDTDGTYTLHGMPVGGQFYVRTDNEYEFNYRNEWYDSDYDTGKTSSPNCSDAELLTVDSDGIPNVDFQLDPTLTRLSGTVYETGGTIGIPGVEIQVFDGKCGEGSWITDVYTDVNGDYTLYGLEAGTYYIRTSSEETGGFYVDEWYNNKSISDCESADGISIGVGNYDERNFILEKGGAISGTVYDSDGTIPIAGMVVEAYSAKCWNGWVGNARTDGNGEYTIMGVPAGTVYVTTCSDCPWDDSQPLNYIDEWFQSSGVGTTDCNSALPVSVTQSTYTQDIDFLLSEGVTISGTVYQDNGTTPLIGTQLSVQAVQGDPCEMYIEAWTDIDTTDGTYTLTGLEPGDYYVKTNNNNMSNYINEWWAYSGTRPPDSDPGSTDCDYAVYLTGTGGEDLADVDFWLELGGAVTGTVTYGGSPVQNMVIEADQFVEGGGGAWLGSAQSDETGVYTIRGLPVTSVVVRTCVTCDWGSPHNPDLNYMDEYYDNVVSHANAATISITSEGLETDVDFAMDEDADHDGMGDLWETGHFGDTTRDGLGDYDNDDLWDYDEFYNDTDPTDFDTDDDWVSDGYEIMQGTDPLSDGEWKPAGYMSISGTLYEGDTTITGVQVRVNLFNTYSEGDACDAGDWPANALTDPETGGFKIIIAPVVGDTYYLQTDNMNQTNYINGWYNTSETPSEADCSNATGIAAVDNGDVTGKDIYLDLGASISGLVAEEFVLTPVVDMQVQAFTSSTSDACGTLTWRQSAHTDESGAYIIMGLPASTDVYVSTCDTCSETPQGYIDEWYDDWSTDEDCSNYDAVTTGAAESNTSGVDFELEGGEEKEKLEGDFDGDGTMDLLWRNSSTGEVYIWLMDGLSSPSKKSLGTVALDWQIEEIGQFNLDGTTDLLWRNQNTGEVYIWLMDGLNNPSRKSFGTVELDWQIEEIGQFNLDGTTDLLWRNQSTGEVYIWLMDGLNNPSKKSLGTVALEWQITEIEQFDTVSTTDLLWRNQNTGEVYIWLMDGLNNPSKKSLGTVALDWQIEEIGLFDTGIPPTDLLWRNQNTGEVYIWLMDGLNNPSKKSLGTVELDWQIVESEQFNSADSTTDLLWRSQSTGEVYIWLMDGLNNPSRKSFGTVALDWQIEETGEFDSAGIPDLLWRNQSTGEVYIWLMDGLNNPSKKSFGTVALDWGITDIGQFNLDDTTDLLWRNQDTGEVYIWLMDGLTSPSKKSLGTVAMEWQIINHVMD
jgi:hypothetical protein